VLVLCFMSWNKRIPLMFQYELKACFSHILKCVYISVSDDYIICQDNPSTWQVWQIKMFKQPDHYTGAPCAGGQYKATLKCAFLTTGMSTRAFAREFHVHFSTISPLQQRFRKFGSTSNRPSNHKPCVWRRVDKQFADVNVENSSMMVVGLWYG
jgi:hypothetical protein